MLKVPEQPPKREYPDDDNPLFDMTGFAIGFVLWLALMVWMFVFAVAGEKPQ